MIKPFSYYITAIILFQMLQLNSAGSIPSGPAAVQNNPSGKRQLLNGRIWYDQHSKVEGDQYFLSDSFLKGSVVFNGQKFDELDLKYDLLNDELVLRPESHPIIYLNKEMVDSFTLHFNNRDHKMINAGNDSRGILKGYVNVLYDGQSGLYVKYSKRIYPLAVDGKYDLFVQFRQIYFRKDSALVPVGGKRKLLNLLDDKKKEIRHYIKTSRVKPTLKDIATFVPLLEYYDSLEK